MNITLTIDSETEDGSVYHYSNRSDRILDNFGIWLASQFHRNLPNESNIHPTTFTLKDTSGVLRKLKGYAPTILIGSLGNKPFNHKTGSDFGMNKGTLGTDGTSPKPDDFSTNTFITSAFFPATYSSGQVSFSYSLTILPPSAYSLKEAGVFIKWSDIDNITREFLIIRDAFPEIKEPGGTFARTITVSYNLLL